MTWYYRNIILQRINSIVVLCTRIVLLLESLLCWWAGLRTMLRHLNRRGLNRIIWALLTVYNLHLYYTFFFNVDAVVCQNNGQFQVWELNIWQFIVIVEIKHFLNLNEYYLPIFILSIHFRQISFRNNNNNIVLSMLYAEICPKVRRHNARYNMDNTILLYK